MSTDDERAVLADDLQQRGDPLGELISFMLALEALPATAPPARRNVIERKIATLLDTHHDALYGALAPHVTRLSRPDLLEPALLVTKWSGGFADTIRIGRRPELELADIVRAMRGLPIARFVRRLEIGKGDHPAVVAELQREIPESLRDLCLGIQVYPPDDSKFLANTSALDPLLARLEVAELGTAMEYTTFESTTLKRLRVHRPWAPDYTDPIQRFDARLPAITDLAISSFRIDGGLLDRYPTLRRADLSGAFEADWLERFLMSPHVERIETLKLSGRLDDSQLAALIRLAYRTGKMKLLDLSFLYYGFSWQAREATPPLPPNIKLR